MQGRCTYQLTIDTTALKTMHFDSNSLLSLYRMTQETLTNAAKHSHATQVGVALTQSQENRVAGTGLRWQVCDNGVGISDFNSACKRGSGLDGIRERAWALGGDLQLESATTLELSEKGTVFFAEFLEF